MLTCTCARCKCRSAQHDIHIDGRFIILAPPIYGGEKQGKVSWQGAECLYSVCTLPVYCLYSAKIPPNMDMGILTFECILAKSGM